MKRQFFNLLIMLVGVVVIIGFCFTPSFADDTEIQDEVFGQNYQYTWIPCYSFTPVSSSTNYATSGNYRYFTDSTDMSMDASVNLPSGAYLAIARLYFYDNLSNYFFYMAFNREYGDDTRETLAFLTTGGVMGFSSQDMDIYHTITNKDNTYHIRISANFASSDLKFKGVRLFWKRQISPAPATATFNDVGPGHWAFQSVEALAASGITQGCPDGPNLFCPDKPVTRAAMAAFLARALGLHWPN